MVEPDLIDLNFGCPVPKFVRKYADLAAPMRQAFETYVAECRDGTYPAPEHGYSMGDEELEALRQWAKES